MKISIYETINDGNLGSGWADAYRAAKAFAEYCETQYKEAAKFAAPEGVELDISVTIEVNKNTSGKSTFSVDCEDSEIAYSIESAHGIAWERWCDSSEARALEA